MGRKNKTLQLNIWMNGELVGNWCVTSGGEHQLRYAETWIESELSRPLSLSLPLQPPPLAYKGNIVETFFDNLLPDSIDIRRRIQKRFGIPTMHTFDLLNEIGRDCIGAIQLLNPDSYPENVRCIESKVLTDKEVEDILISTTSTSRFGLSRNDEFRISLAGAQEKTALTFYNDKWQRPLGTTPTTHILKLPIGKIGYNQIDMDLSIENEWLCSQILNLYNIKTAHCKILKFGSKKVLVVKRFDRQINKNGPWFVKLPQEDMCQVVGISSALKYENDGGPGILEIMKLLRGSQTAIRDRKTFFTSQILFWMLAAPDGHAKNFSIFIKPHGRYSLTPLYDVLSAYPVMGKGTGQIAKQKLKMAMAVFGKNKHYNWSKIVLHYWFITGKKCGLNKNGVEEILEDLINKTPNVVSKVNKIVSDNFPREVLDSILKGLLSAFNLLKGM